ncbi:MAG: hypothetical protein ABFD90_10225 [Phycisphaerales bacterium]
MIAQPTVRMRYAVCVLSFFLLTGTPAAAEFAGGTGAPNDPYQIATAEQLISIGSDHDLLDKHFILTADIDLDPDLFGGKVFGRAVIAPTGGMAEPTDDFQGTAFSGVFDGDGHTISNPTIQGTSYLGLFGLVCGTVKNVGVVGAEISGSGNNVGALAGSNRGAIIRCHTAGVVVGSSQVGGMMGQNDTGRVVLCHSSATVTATGNSVGGLVGYNDRGSIVAGYSTGTVSGNGQVGGMLGRNYEGAVSHCYSLGAVTGGMHIGGLIGQNWAGTATHCYSAGAVSGESTFGGLLGSNVDAGRFPGVVIGCFWDIESSGQAASAAGTGVATAPMQDLSTFLAAGWDFADETANGTSNYWQMSAGEYPRLRWSAGDSPAMPEGSGTTEEPYLVRDARDLGTVWFEPAAHYRLDASIDLAGITWSTAVVPRFEGTFDGNDYVISNLHIQGTGYLGLFGESTPDAAISNLGLDAADVNGTGSYVGGLVGRHGGSIASSYSRGAITGDAYVGGLVGSNDGGIETSYATGVVNGTHPYAGGLVGCNFGSVAGSHSAGTVSGSAHVGGLVGCNHAGDIIASRSTAAADGTGSYVGGLVGYSSGSIGMSRSSGPVSGPDHIGGLVGCNEGSVAASCSSSVVEGGDLVGGLVGSNWGHIANSYSGGTVAGDNEVGGLVGCNFGAPVGFHTGGSITRCYSTGAVSGSGFVGGLVGSSGTEGVTAGFWDTETSGQSASAIGEGKTTAELQTASTFLEAWWDFADETANGTEDIWWITEGADYPRLWWE